MTIFLCLAESENPAVGHYGHLAEYDWLSSRGHRHYESGCMECRAIMPEGGDDKHIIINPERLVALEELAGICERFALNCGANIDIRDCGLTADLLRRCAPPAVKGAK